MALLSHCVWVSPPPHPQQALLLYLCPPSSLLKGQMSSMEICKSVEVYSATRLDPLPLQLHPTIILFLSIAAKKGAKQEGERTGASSSPFFGAHFKICCFFSVHPFSSPKAFFFVENSPLNWWQSRGLCWLFKKVFLSTINRPWIHSHTHTHTHIRAHTHIQAIAQCRHAHPLMCVHTDLT